jgi:ribose-phosphate pyrophosphokinase
MITVYNNSTDKRPINRSFPFSGGEIQVFVEQIYVDPVTIYAHITSSDDILELMMTVDAIRRSKPAATICLKCPYFPYARQDRVMNPGEALSLKVMCDIINGLNFASVEVWDAHSDVTLALLDNVTNYGPETFVQLIAADKQNTILVAPDAGAIKKVFKVAKGLGFEMITASKHRSTKDGSITDTEVHSGHVGDKDFLIVDDICDGGRTFIELAKKLKPLTTGKILLYVTHGIFSKGITPLEDLFDGIYVAKPFPGVDLTHPFLHVLPTGV